MPRIACNGTVLNVTLLPQRRPRMRGEGTPIVMVHGLAASQAFWHLAGAPVLTVLGPCLLYDLRGHGKSDAPQTGYGVSVMAADLAALLDAQGIGRAHLVAHSFGGMIALYLALTAPERVASLVLADVRVRPLQRRLQVPVGAIPPAAARRLEALGIDVAALGGAGEGVDYLSAVARIEVAAGDEAGELLDALYKHPRLFRTPRAAQKWIELTERASLVKDLDSGPSFTAADLARLAMPMLVLVGETSATRPSAVALARHCPHAVLREIPKVGHFFPVSAPRLFLRPTLRFLNAANKGRAPARAGG